MADEIAAMPQTADSVNGPFPEELRGFNWGAFFLSWIWAVNHRIWIGLGILVLSLLSMIQGIGFIFSILGFIACVVFGFKGNALAWKHRKFENVEQFQAVQQAWARWGFVVFVVVFVATLAFMYYIYSIVGIDSLLDTPAPQVT